jgi:hypothetical protein
MQPNLAQSFGSRSSRDASFRECIMHKLSTHPRPWIAKVFCLHHGSRLSAYYSGWVCSFVMKMKQKCYHGRVDQHDWKHALDVDMWRSRGLRSVQPCKQPVYPCVKISLQGYLEDLECWMPTIYQSASLLGVWTSMNDLPSMNSPPTKL